MPKKSKTRNPTDPNLLARSVIESVLGESLTSQPEKSAISRYLSEIGRKGGLKGGKSRATNLSPKRRKEIAKKAAKTRWSKP